MDYLGQYTSMGAPVACSLPVTTCQSVGQHAGGAAGCVMQSTIRRGYLAGIDRVLPLHAEMKWLPLRFWVAFGNNDCHFKFGSNALTKEGAGLAARLALSWTHVP